MVHVLYFFPIEVSTFSHLRYMLAQEEIPSQKVLRKVWERWSISHLQLGISLTVRRKKKQKGLDEDAFFAWCWLVTTSDDSIFVSARNQLNSNIASQGFITANPRRSLTQLSISKWHRFNWIGSKSVPGKLRRNHRFHPFHKTGSGWIRVLNTDGWNQASVDKP